MHDVCPEYNSQILAARAVCEAAPAELQHARELYCELQDPFNTAARFLFCEDGVLSIDQGFVADETANTTQDLDPFKQLVIFRLTVMDTTNDKKLKKDVATDDLAQIRVTSTKTQTYRVISVHRRRKAEKKLLEKLLAQQGMEGQVKSAGTLELRRSIIDHAYSNLPRPDEFDRSMEQEPTEKFILDDDVLAKVQVGMKMHLEVCELNIGVRFIKAVRDVRVSFDTLLPQSLMFGWKAPVENERPAPSVDNPGSGCIEAPSFDDI